MRDTGVAYDREESTVGISAVGAEIRDSGGIVAALSIPVPTARFADQEVRLVKLLLATCVEVSASLGANGHTGT